MPSILYDFRTNDSWPSLHSSVKSDIPLSGFHTFHYTPVKYSSNPDYSLQAELSLLHNHPRSDSLQHSDCRHLYLPGWCTLDTSDEVQILARLRPFHLKMLLVYFASLLPSLLQINV